MLIAIEGIDGSGKGTQARLLSERLRTEGRTVGLISFPRYQDTYFGGLIGKFLNGDFGTLDEVHPFFAAMLFAGDRHESREHLEQMLQDHDIVICDRYVASNIAHQGARAIAEERETIISQIKHLEYEIHQLPRAELTILLDLDVARAQALVAKKDPRSYTEKLLDIQEGNAAYLESVRTVYQQLSAAEDWQVIPCAEGNRLRSIEAISQDVREAIPA